MTGVLIPSLLLVCLVSLYATVKPLILIGPNHVLRYTLFYSPLHPFFHETKWSLNLQPFIKKRGRNGAVYII